jgi:peptidoglycan/LPS O-acetylase OafA/YrhL
MNTSAASPAEQRGGDFSDATSLYFDLLRFVAAVLVVFEHFRLFDFLPTHTWIASFSHEAVIAFFVLSGAVIAHAADRPDTSLRSFVIARAVRIYSVALPAIGFAYLVAFGFFRYGGNAAIFGHDPSLTSTAAWYTLLTTAFFLNESWFIWNEAVWNGPYWSLCYEVWYYVIFACAFFSRSTLRWVLIGLACLLAGPRILALLPVWLLGVWFKHFAPKIPERPAAGSLLVITTLVAIALIGNSELEFQVWDAIHARLPQLWVLQSSAFFLTDYVVALLFVANFIGIQMCRAWIGGGLRCWRAQIRWLAASTFSIYLFHYPVVLALAATLDRSRLTLPISVAMLTALIALCILLSFATERRKDVLAAAVRRWLGDKGRASGSERARMIGTASHRTKSETQ